MDRSEELARRIRDAAGEWDDKELPVQAVVSEMRDVTQNQAEEITSLRGRLRYIEQAVTVVEHRLTMQSNQDYSREQAIKDLRAIVSEP